jgi:glycosyltransferase involved in cell wall biosynthesis
MGIDLIIPLYNKKNYIGKCLNSALNQQYIKFNKIIVVNDGSTDGGDIEVEKISKENSNVELFNQINLGSSAARNKGIKLSNAEFVVFLDADDQLHHKYLLSINLMKQMHPKSNIFSTKHYNVYNNFELINNSKDIKIYKSKVLKLRNPIFSYSINPKIFCSSGICIRRRLFDKIHFPEGINVGEDIYTWLKLFKTNELIFYDKELILIFKISENRSIDIFNEIPYYLKKINEFKISKSITYLLYFSIASIIYLYQKKSDISLVNYFLKNVKYQSKFLFILLNLANNKILHKFYQIYKKRKNEEENRRIFPKIENFYILTMNYFFILPGIPLIILSIYWSGNYSSISDILLMSSITIFTTSSISFYARPFTIISNKFKDALVFQKIKKILIFPILLLLLIINYYMGLGEIFILNISIIFILYLWRVEADLVIYELQGSKKKLTNNLIEIIFLICLLIISIFFQNKFFEILILTFFSLILIFKNYKILKRKKIISSFKLIKNVINENTFYVTINSFILNFTNFIHRYLILLFVDKVYAGILFFAFSLGSFPANLFSFVFGATIIRNRKTIPKIGVYLFILYFLLALYLIYLSFNDVADSMIYIFLNKDHLMFISYSMIGGVIMSYALFRKNKIFTSHSIKKIFFPELLYSFSILSLVPFIYFYFDENYFKLIFLLNAIIAFLIFSPFSKALKNE